MGELNRLGAATVIVPTIGRPSLHAMLASLAASPGEPLHELIVVDDRQKADPAIVIADDPRSVTRTRLLRSGGSGPAAARNVGLRHARTPFIVFLDDDVELEKSWRRALERDLGVLLNGSAGSAAQISVPLPEHRKPTDWERNVAGLSRSAWITADMAYRRDVLLGVGGFDERFPRAYREDADLALRLMRAGHSLTVGTRRTRHPVRCADRWISVRLQRGNADDVLMRALHGGDWRRRASAPRGRFALHALTCAAAAATALFWALGLRRGQAVAASLWLMLSADFTWRRIAPGPRNADEILTMLVTSVAIPFSAVYHASVAACTLRQRLRVR